MNTNQVRQYFKRVAGNRIVQHVLFWTLSFVSFVNFFSTSDEIGKIDVIYTLLFHLSLALAVYLNIWFLIPRLLRKGKYLYYTGSLITLIVIAALFNQITFDKLVDFILPGYYFISFYELDDILIFIFIYVTLTSLLKLSKGWFMLMETNRRLLMIEKEKTETELKALKSQVNPHFLFNSLNNIYSLALNKSEMAPKVILRLSELMRYMLYESNVPEVPLANELKYIKNYIELQKIRSDENAEISYRFKGKVGKQMIAPLLFLPFIENSFKHGIKGETVGGFVEITLELKDEELIFTAENNKGKVDDVAVEKDQGIGLQNVRRQLELIYPGNHTLEIKENDLTYRTELKIIL